MDANSRWIVGLVLLALAAFLLFLGRRVWLRYTPKGRLFFGIGFACLATVCGIAPYFTSPSSAPRVTTTGQLWTVKRVPSGKTHFTEFSLGHGDGTSVFLQTPIDPVVQGKDGPYIQRGQIVRVTYLDEKRDDGMPPRAISIEILEGPNAGWHDSVDANWFGVWLLVPVGLAGLLISFVVATKNLSSTERKRIEMKS